MQNRRYPIDLSANMAVCDANYIRILKLLPLLSQGVSRTIVLPGFDMGTEDSMNDSSCEYTSASPGCLVMLHVEEKSRYTTTITMKQVLQGMEATCFRPPVVAVRLYHDASTAEVVSYQDQYGYHLCSRQGDSPEFSADEKQQANTLLSEWLILCMEHGLSQYLPGEDYNTEQPMPFM